MCKTTSREQAPLLPMTNPSGSTTTYQEARDLSERVPPSPILLAGTCCSSNSSTGPSYFFIALHSFFLGAGINSLSDLDPESEYFPYDLVIGVGWTLLHLLGTTYQIKKGYPSIENRYCSSAKMLAVSAASVTLACLATRYLPKFEGDYGNHYYPPSPDSPW